jgi:hypothetical protein
MRLDGKELIMTPRQEQQKKRDLEEAEHYMRYGSVPHPRGKSAPDPSDMKKGHAK